MKLRSLLFGLLLAGLLSQPAQGLFFKKTPPVQQPVLVNTLIGEPYHFSPEDFSLSGSTAPIYHVSGLPDPSIGVLQIGAELVTDGSSLTESALSGLTYYPLEDSIREITFYVTPEKDGCLGQPASVTILFLSAVNQPPVLGDADFITYRKSTLNDCLPVTDPEGDQVSLVLVQSPSCGRLTLAADGSGCFRYEPGRRSGTFSFLVAAVDDRGSRSQPKEYRISVKRSAAAATYADLTESPLRYPAERLARSGLLLGEWQGEALSLHPETPLTRSEFLMMLMHCAQIAPAEAVSTLPFADDPEISSLSRPYWCAAYELGLISPTGRCHPNAPISSADAILLTERVLPYFDHAVSVFSPQGDSEPVLRALHRLKQLQVIPYGLEESTHLSRGDGVILLAGLLDLI